VSDVPRLLTWFKSDTLLRPDANVPNTVDLARALASLAGADGIDLGEGARAIRDAIGAADHCVFALIDGLGMNLLESLPTTSFFREHVTMELRAVFPATTATALTSLATGLWPAQHAVTGWWTYLPDHRLTATILLFIERFSERPLAEAGVTGEDAFREPSLMPTFQRDTQAVLPRGLTGSTYSQYVAGGTAVNGYDTLAEGVDGIVKRIATATRPTYTYFYYPVIDGLEHALGPRAAQVRDELARVELELARLAQAIAGRGRLAVSADHGMLEIGDDGRRFIADGDALLTSLVAPPSGEPRVPYFHVQPGEHDRFESVFRERFGEDFALVSVAEAQDLRLFGPGPLSEAARARIGDYVGLAAAPRALILGSPSNRTGPAGMRGFHGGMTPEEMRIPLIVA